MEYEDRITIWAPEGLALEYTLAGLGSRFLAGLVDLALRVIVLGAVLAILEIAGAPSTVVLIVFIVGAFLALFAYDIAFEVWADGRTPGKRWNGLRVLMADGQPVTFGPSAVRNLLRIIDIWATAMTVGAISILVTKRNQRLGDLAGGTIVVRERRAGTVRFSRNASDPTTALVAAAAPGALGAPGVRAPSPPPALPALRRARGPRRSRRARRDRRHRDHRAELSAVRDFLARRERLSREARIRVAGTLASTLSPKVGGLPPHGLGPEPLLETIAAAKAASGYGSGSRP